MNAPPPQGQFPAIGMMIPRFREAGDVTLDLLHCDGRVDDCWLALHPHEFAMLWRLAQQPGQPVSRQDLAREVWRIDLDPERGSIAIDMVQVRSRLAPHGLAWLIGEHCDGSYFLNVPRSGDLSVHTGTAAD